MDDNPAAIIPLSLSTGRVSLMLLYDIRPGSWWTYLCSPPSSVASMASLTPSPLQPVKIPISLPSMVTVKQVLIAGSSIVVALAASSSSSRSADRRALPVRGRDGAHDVDGSGSAHKYGGPDRQARSP